MNVEVMMLSPPRDFNFDSGCTTPYLSAPSSPPHFGNHTNFYYSAPASPTRASAFYHAGTSAVPFGWEEKPGTPKAKQAHLSTATSSNYGDPEEDLDDVDFAFDFSGNLEKHDGYLPADELFDGGKIKPLKPPPRFQYDVQQNHSNNHSPKSPRSPKAIIRGAFSPRKKEIDLDPFAVALEQTRNESIYENDQRGRGRSNISNSRQHKKATRSLSPFRVSDLLIEPDTSQTEQVDKSPSPVSLFSSFWYKKWKIKDLLLFRSASESRATDTKEEMKKYSLLKKTTVRQEHSQELKNSSFRSTESVGSMSRRKSGPPISAHELHYTVNRAVSEEMKKRTSLPYKQGLLGCLGFHPAGPDHVLSSNGSMSRG